jgi:hypothetical protein
MSFMNSYRGAAILALLALTVAGCKGNKNLTKANYDQIKPGMTLADVQKLLGAPTDWEAGGLAMAEGSGVAAATGIGDMQSMSQSQSRFKTYKWGTDSRYIKVTFLEEKVAADKFKAEKGLN